MTGVDSFTTGPAGSATDPAEAANDPAGAASDPAGAGIDPADAAVVAAQLGRSPRGRFSVAHRCPCGLPDVVRTAPRLPDGTPFPTLYYLTCPRACAAAGRLEAGGMMAGMTQRLTAEGALRQAYLAAHLDYLARRDAAARECGLEPLPLGTQSAGGMPDRVKCLHALIAHELAVPGVNPLGREAAEAAGQWWSGGPCVPPLAGPDARPGAPQAAGAAHTARTAHITQTAQAPQGAE